MPQCIIGLLCLSLHRKLPNCGMCAHFLKDQQQHYIGYVMLKLTSVMGWPRFCFRLVGRSWTWVSIWHAEEICGFGVFFFSSFPVETNGASESKAEFVHYI